MSILIKGMEMPESCYYCPFADGVWQKDKRCLINGEEMPRDERGVQQNHINCPLIEIPPHGRLIDADAYRAEMKKRQDACAEWRDDIKDGGGYGTELYYRADSFLGAMCEAKLTLDKMPTIIPAEEGEGC